jgi:hypothetical protein
MVTVSIISMVIRAFILFSILLFGSNVIGQTRTLTGKIIDQEFYPVYQVMVFNVDTVLLTTSDKNGNFSISVPLDTKSLIVASLAMEWKNLDITDACTNLEIILLPSGTYDFMTANKVDRLRKKQFDKLPTLHKSAFEKGLFKTEKPCYIDKFISIKKRLKEIHKNRTQQPSA